MRLNWWDTVHGIQHVVTLPARILDILPAAGGIAAATLPPASALPSNPPDLAAQTDAPLQLQVNHNAKPMPWIWLSVALALLWLGTVFGWWYTRRRAQPSRPEKIREPSSAAAPNATGTFKAFRSACLNNNPQAARKNLLAWAATAWPANPPSGLNELSRRLGGAELIEALRQLDRACYADDTWHGPFLAKLLPAPPKLASPVENRQVLPALYP